MVYKDRIERFDSIEYHVDFESTRISRVHFSGHFVKYTRALVLDFIQPVDVPTKNDQKGDITVLLNSLDLL